jgi:uncharacterized protein YjiS (DUF1127 family)
MTNHHELGFVPGIRALLRTWRERGRVRRELGQLSERELHDVGLSWTDVASEVDKPFWRA